jgi:hypothetical protein
LQVVGVAAGHEDAQLEVIRMAQDIEQRRGELRGVLREERIQTGGRGRAAVASRPSHGPAPRSGAVQGAGRLAGNVEDRALKNAAERALVWFRRARSRHAEIDVELSVDRIILGRETVPTRIDRTTRELDRSALRRVIQRQRQELWQGHRSDPTDASDSGVRGNTTFEGE